MKVIIIEDEILLAEDLAATLQEIDSSIEVIARLTSVEDSVRYLKGNCSADLIFSDIALSDGLSFEIFQKVEVNIPIIFCTAYDEYALDAFKANGIEYLLKPFDKPGLEKALNKFDTLKQTLNKNLKNQYEAAVEALASYQQQKADTLMVRYRNKVIPISMSQIALFFVEDELTYLYTFKHQKYIIPESLEELESASGLNFFRVNRQFLVNREAVLDATNYLIRKLRLNLVFNFQREIIISKEKKGKLLSWLQG